MGCTIPLGGGEVAWKYAPWEAADAGCAGVDDAIGWKDADVTGCDKLTFTLFCTLTQSSTLVAVL